MKSLINNHLTLPPLYDNKKKEMHFVFNEKDLLALMQDVSKISWSFGQLAKHYTDNPSNRPDNICITFADFWERRTNMPHEYMAKYAPVADYVITLRNKINENIVNRVISGLKNMDTKSVFNNIKKRFGIVKEYFKK